MNDKGPVIRRDLIFCLDVDAFGETSGLQSMHDFLVRVEHMEHGKPIIRYGLLIDFKGHGEYFKNNYLLQIPTKETDPTKIQKAQEKIIKQYINEMREKWGSETSGYLGERAGNVWKSLTIASSEYDKLRMNYDSTEGQWQILRDFWTDKSLFKSFFKWMLDTQLDSPNPAEFENQLQNLRMPFQTGRKYGIFLDWALPYICFEHFFTADTKYKTPSPTKDHFYPFYDFINYTYNVELKNRATEVTIDSFTDYMRKYSVGIKLKPTYYASFAYFACLIEKIEEQKKESFENLKHYFAYIKNLTQIQSVFVNYGPLGDKDPEEIKAWADRERANWDGGVSDSTFFAEGEEENISHLALGLTDIINLKEVFFSVIEKETAIGRNSGLSVGMESDTWQLKSAFFSDTSKDLYNSLWCYNKDRFGYNLFLLKANSLFSQSHCADDVYKEYMKKHLYENEILEDPANHYDKIKNDPSLLDWNNMAYRSENVLVDLWIMYYKYREKRLGGLAEIVTVAANKWKLVDPQLRKFTNFLMGGNKIDEINSAVAEITSGVKKIMAGTVDRIFPTTKQLEKISRLSQNVKKKLFQDSGIDTNITKGKIRIAKTGGGAALIAINLVIVKASYDTAVKEDNVESTARCVTAALSAASDIGGLAAARLYGVEATLSRKALKRIVTVGGKRVALSLGILQGVAGSIGGVLGTVWFTVDSIRGFCYAERKDAVLDAISAAGCALEVYGLFCDSSIIGIPVGIACHAIGLVMIIGAQAVKLFDWWSGEIEDYCHHLYAKEIEENGMDKMDTWVKELEIRKVRYAWDYLGNEEELLKLTNRVKEFLADWDTFDSKLFPMEFPKKE